MWIAIFIKISFPILILELEFYESSTELDQILISLKRALDIFSMILNCLFSTIRVHVSPTVCSRYGNITYSVDILYFEIFFYLFNKLFTKYLKKVDFPTSFPPHAIITGACLLTTYYKNKKIIELFKNIVISISY